MAVGPVEVWRGCCFAEYVDTAESSLALERYLFPIFSAGCCHLILSGLSRRGVPDADTARLPAAVVVYLTKHTPQIFPCLLYGRLKSLESINERSKTKIQTKSHQIEHKNHVFDPQKLAVGGWRTQLHL